MIRKGREPLVSDRPLGQPAHGIMAAVAWSSSTTVKSTTRRNSPRTLRIPDSVSGDWMIRYSLNHKPLPSLSFHESSPCPSRDPSHQEAAGGALYPGQGILQAPLEVPGEPAAGDDRETPGFLRPCHDLRDVGKREFLQPVAQPAAPVPAVGKHLRDPPPGLAREVHDHVRRTIPILHVGRVHMHHDRVAFHVHRDVSFPSPDLPAGIVSRRPVAFRRLHRSTVDDRPRRRHTTASLRPRQGAKRVRPPFRDPVIPPDVKTVPDRGRRRMTGRNEPPPTSRRQHGPDRIEHPSEGPSPGVGPSGPVSGAAGQSAPVPRPSDRLAHRHADGHAAPGRPRSTPWHPPSSVVKLPTGYHSTRPPATSGTDTYISATAAHGLVADLDRVMTVEKAVVANWTRIHGRQTDAESREFARALTKAFEIRVS